MIRARCQYQYSVCLFLSYRLGTKQPVCLGGVTVLYACAPSLRLELAVSVWQGGLGAGPLAHSQELPAQCFFLLKLPEEPEQTAQNGLSLDRLPGRFGSELTELAPETSAPSPGMSTVQGNLKLESRSQCFIATKRDYHGYVCMNPCARLHSMLSYRS